jgi:NADH dehydrogenase FAD-containing subunit
VAENAHGFRDIPEALHLRDHVIRQIELADAADDPAERAARLTFVVVGADYTGTEVVAQIQLLTHDVLSRHPRLAGVKPRWLLLDTADHVLPGRDSRLAATAERVLRERGIEVDMGTSVAEATAAGVKLTDDRFVPSRTLVWCIGVRPDPLTQSTGLPLTRGRVQVDEYLAVPGHPEILACGDAARGARPVAASGGPCLEQWTVSKTRSRERTNASGSATTGAKPGSGPSGTPHHATDAPLPPVTGATPLVDVAVRRLSQPDGLTTGRDDRADRVAHP